MKKWLISLLIFLVGCATVNRVGPYGSGPDDSNTVNTLPTPGASSFASTTKTFLSKEDANRWAEQGVPFQNWVSVVANASSCLGVAGAGLTMTPTACIAYNAGYRGTDTHSIVFPNGSTCWVAMDENTAGSNPGLGNFTRVTASHYLIDCIDVGQPAMVADSQLLMKVVTAGGAVTTVTDLRTTKPLNATGTVSSITATSPVVVTPSPIVTTGVISLTTVPPNLGGTGGTGITAHDVAIGEGSSAMAGLPLAVDEYPQGQGASLDPIATAMPACANDGLHAIVYVAHAFVCETVTAGIAVHGQQLFTSNGTFTVPANVFSVTFECWGGGGGGGGYGAAGVDGGNGGTTTVTTICKATGGLGASAIGAGSDSGGGGGASIGSAIGTITLRGSNGLAGHTNTGLSAAGGIGGIAPRGDGAQATAGTGFGVGGQGGGTGSPTVGAGGGGGGGYSEVQVTTTPATTFAVTLGAGGTAGTGGTQNGAAGAPGRVLATW